MGNLGAVGAVVHQQKLQIVGIGNNNLAEAIGQHMSMFLVGAITDVGHDDATSLELSADTGIDTLGSAPAFLQDDSNKGEMWGRVSGGGMCVRICVSVCVCV